MPIVSVQLVTSPGSPGFDQAVTQTLADRLGYLFQSEPGTTWVKLFELDRTAYAENGESPDGSIQPTFVEVLHRLLPDEAELAEEAKLVSACVAEVLGRPQQNVHVIYLPEGAGRVAFGGTLVPGRGT